MMNSILFLNIFFYLFWFLHRLKHDKYKLTVYSFLFLLYTIVAFLGWFTYNNGIYSNVFGIYNTDRLTVLPYLLCFITVLIVTSPFKDFQLHSLLRINNMPDTKNLNKFLKVCLLIIIVNFICVLYLYLTKGSGISYSDAYEESSAGETSFKFDSSLYNFVYFNLIRNLSDILIPFYVYVSLYMVSFSRKYRLKHTIGIVCVYVIKIFPLVITAARGSIFFTTMQFIFVGMLYYRYIPKNIKRLFLLVGVICFVVLFSFVLLITESRFGGNDSDSLDGILRYFGESYPNLGFRVWDYEINHPYGLRLFPSLGSLFGFDLNYNFNDRYGMFDFWEVYVGIPMLNFKTIFGDLYVEFGLIGAFAFILLVNAIVKKGLKSQIPFANFTTAYYLFYVCVYGLFCYGLREHIVMQVVKTLVVLIILDKFYFKKKRNGI